MIQKIARGRYPELSVLTYRQWFEGKDMKSGWIVTKDSQVFTPPFTVEMEEIK